MARKAASLIILSALMAVLAATSVAAATTDSPNTKLASQVDPSLRVMMEDSSFARASGGRTVFFKHCTFNGRAFPHHQWFYGLQCCDGVWTHGGCSTGDSSGSMTTRRPDSSSGSTPAAAAPKVPAQTSQASNRKLLGGVRQCTLNGRFFGHLLWFANLQCCDGSWSSNGCSGGSCMWRGQSYPSFSWSNNYQCCTGSWRYNGCSSGGSSSCMWQGQSYPSFSWYDGYQCCSGSWSRGGCNQLA